MLNEVFKRLCSLEREVRVLRTRIVEAKQLDEVADSLLQLFYACLRDSANGAVTKRIVRDRHGQLVGVVETNGR